MTSSPHSELDEALRCAKLWVEKPLTDEEWEQAARTQALPAIRPDIELLARNFVSLFEQIETLQREQTALDGESIRLNRENRNLLEQLEAAHEAMQSAAEILDHARLASNPARSPDA